MVVAYSYPARMNLQMLHRDNLFQEHLLVQKRKIKVPFETISRADRMMDVKVVETLKALGCYRIWIGAESGSQRMLDHYHKQIDVEDIYKTCANAKKNGVVVAMSLIVNHPK